MKCIVTVSGRVKTTGTSEEKVSWLFVSCMKHICEYKNHLWLLNWEQDAEWMTADLHVGGAKRSNRDLSFSVCLLKHNEASSLSGVEQTEYGGSVRHNGCFWKSCWCRCFVLIVPKCCFNKNQTAKWKQVCGNTESPWSCLTPDSSEAAAFSRLSPQTAHHSLNMWRDVC